MCLQNLQIKILTVWLDIKKMVSLLSWVRKKVTEIGWVRYFIMLKECFSSDPTPAMKNDSSSELT